MTFKNIHVRYVGNGSSFVIGVPQKDLSEEEWTELSEQVKELAISSGVYQIVQKQEVFQDLAKKFVKEK